MTTLGYIALPLGLLVFSVWSHLEAYKRGYEKGRKDAEKDADEWWLGMEEEVDRERVKIWREET